MFAATPQSSVFRPASAIVALIFAAGCAGSDHSCECYSSPEDAMASLRSLLGCEDGVRANVVFGPDCQDLIGAEALIVDDDDTARVKALIDERVEFEYPTPDCAIALLGEVEWPFAVPLVRDGDSWYFDTAAGAVELQNRHIGENELDTLTTLNELVLAQREYRDSFPDGATASYADRFRSSPEQRDGLFWESSDELHPCPIGGDLAAADCTFLINAYQPRPFQGYFYRILTGQGDAAPGGARSYLDDDGRLIHGFAIIAWPAVYGETGVMTFLVNDRGIIYEEDFGPLTAKLINEIALFDPGSTWVPASP